MLTTGLYALLIEQMWGDSTSIVRKSGVFSILYEAGFDAEQPGAPLFRVGVWVGPCGPLFGYLAPVGVGRASAWRDSVPRPLKDLVCAVCKP